MTASYKVQALYNGDVEDAELVRVDLYNQIPDAEEKRTMMDEQVTRINLAKIAGAINSYDAKHGYVPTHVLQMDGRTLRALEGRGLIRLSAQDNGSRDARYLSTWSDVTLTKRAMALLSN